MATYLPRPVLGVDYYPEHWPEENWRLDAEQMRVIGLKVVRIGEFAWSKLEPRQEVYDFDWIDRAVETLDTQGLKVIIGTPTAAPPPWMAEMRPDILARTREGQVLTVGGRRFYCPSNAFYRTQTFRIARELARHFLQNYSVIGWQIDNEMGNHGNCRCYCATCKLNWHSWLQQRYNSVDNLNKAWGTIFWGQEFREWSQVPLPTGTGARYSPSLELDYYRFASDNAIEYFNLQLEAIREFWTPQRGFITHNIFYGDDNIDFFKMSAGLDFIAFDNYPHGMKATSDLAFYHDYVYGLKNEPHWVMEQAAGPINWTKYNPAVAPGQTRLWTLQNFLRGVQGTVYFNWREARFGGEQYHSGILNHDGRQHRVYHEIMSLSEELDKLPDNFFRKPKAKVALLFGFEDLWALQLEPHNEAFDYLQILKDIHASLLKRHVQCDILPRGTNSDTLKEYSLVVAAAPIISDYDESNDWQRFVVDGGKLLLITRVGAKEPSNVWTDRPQPAALYEWLNIRVEEMLSFPPYLPGAHPNKLIGDTPADADVPVSLYDEVTGRTLQAKRLWLELLDPQEGTEIILRYGKVSDSDFFQGSVGLASCKLGNGEAYYLGVLPTAGTFDYLWVDLFRQECAPAVDNLPRYEGFEVIRTGDQGQYFALLNHNGYPLTIPLGTTYYKLDGSAVEQVTLKPYDVHFFRG